MIWFRALLLAFASLCVSVAQACPDIGSPNLGETTLYVGYSSDPAYTAAAEAWFAKPGNCGINNLPTTGGLFRLVGYYDKTTTPPSSCPAAGTVTGGPGGGVSIAISSLSVTPKFGCDPLGCQIEPVEWSTAVRSCDASGACHANFVGARSKHTGATCDPSVPAADGDPAPQPKPGDPKDPLSPNLKPIDNPDGIFPGCKNNTDPGCKLEKLPPGCKKTTTTTATGGVNEKTVCEEVTCSPSICKKVSTSDDKSWATGGGFKAGDPPDSQSTKTTETVQTRDGSGSGAGSGTAGGTGTGTNGGSSSISGVGMSDLDGDGYMDGDTDKDGKCDVNCTKKTDQSGESSYCEENPKSSLCEKKDESGCAKESKGIGCMEPGTAPDEKVGKSEVNLGLKSSPVSFGGGGGCPAPTVVMLGGAAATLIDPGPVCGVLSSVARPIVILIALFAGALIIFKGVEV